MKKTLQNGSLILVSIIIGLLIVEMLVRVFVPQQLIVLRPDIWMPDSLTGFRRCPDIDTRVNWGEAPVRLVTDADGYRIDDSSDRVKRKTDIAILTVGDSFLEALQVENEHTITRVIRDLLESRYAITVTADNASAGGWDPNHYRMEAIRALEKNRYDLGIVFFYVANDVVKEKLDSVEIRLPTIRRALRFPSEFSMSELVDAVLYPINDVLERNSHLFVLSKKKARNVLARTGLTAYYFPEVFERAESNLAMWDVTTSIFEEIQAVFARHGTPVFFVLLPTVYQVDEERFKTYIDWFDIDPLTVDLNQPNRELGARFAAAGLPLLDPLNALKERRVEDGELYGTVDTHFVEAGHRAVAEFVLPVIESYLPGELKPREPVRRD
jgi:hypothetical protein